MNVEERLAKQCLELPRHAGNLRRLDGQSYRRGRVWGGLTFRMSCIGLFRPKSAITFAGTGNIVENCVSRKQIEYLTDFVLFPPWDGANLPQ